MSYAHALLKVGLIDRPTPAHAPDPLYQVAQGPLHVIYMLSTCKLRKTACRCETQRAHYPDPQARAAADAVQHKYAQNLRTTPSSERKLQNCHDGA
jgi:hypothetical protein